ncbi:MAG: twin-arginine translocation signal domain-containing protein, partial [Chloracidobacterium sp.]|nr:twin-arginine translocation signal domain-containing protein [Chloracidobacterium sp.]
MRQSRRSNPLMNADNEDVSRRKFLKGTAATALSGLASGKVLG